MLRRHFWPGFIGLLAGVGTAGAYASPAAPPAPRSYSVPQPTPVSGLKVEERAGFAVVYYDASLTPSQMLERAATDAGRLGFPLAKTLSVGKAAILKGSPAAVEAALRAAEGLPIRHVAPAYSVKGSFDVEGMFAFTSRLQISFAPDVSEAEKEALYAANGFRRIRETAGGAVLVETGRNPGIGMAALAVDVARSSASVNGAQFDFLATGRPTASDSIQIDDPLFKYQWSLFNAAVNTLGGTADEDIDAPRAWQINRRRGRTNYFGSPEVIVGVLDSGTELGHEDLAESIDPTVGIDAVDGGLPLPQISTFGAHGTAIAGLVAAQANEVGVVGTSPGVKIYSVRIFGEDYSFSSAAVYNSIVDTVFKNVDVNVHAYTLDIDATSALASTIEAGLQQCFESGRDGRGLANVCAAGNYWGNVEFPATSEWVFAVGATLDDGSRGADSNFGGQGIDFTMPGFDVTGFDTASLDSTGTGIVTTDLSRSSGYAPEDPDVPDNEAGNYGTLGYGLGTTSYFDDGSFSLFDFRGTSVAAAHGAGAVALMYSDERYVDLTTHNPVRRSISRASSPILGGSPRPSAAERAPFRPFDSTILSKLKNHSDLPAGRDNYFWQAHPYYGFGRPNPSRALAGGTGEPTQDTVYFPWRAGAIPLADGSGSFDFTFNMRDIIGATIRASDDPDAKPIEEYTKGWIPDEAASVQAFIEGQAFPAGEDPEPAFISPHMQAIRTLYFEDAEPLVADPLKPELFFYVWTDSLTTASSVPTTLDDTAANLIYNPFGRYLQGTLLRLLSPPAQAINTGPLQMEIEIGYELGVENVSTVSAGVDATRKTEIDELRVEIVATDQDGVLTDEVYQTVATFTGNSGDSRKERPKTAVALTLPGPPEVTVPDWPLEDPEVPYRPWVSEDQMLIRRYRFQMPPVLDEDGQPKPFGVRLVLDPGTSILPEFVPAQDGTFAQARSIYRDYQGFIFRRMAIRGVSNAFLNYYRQNTFEPMDAYFPDFGPAKTDIFGIQNSSVGGSFLVRNDPFATYITNPYTNTLDRTNRDRTVLVESSSKITGLKAHPYADILALTTEEGTADGLYVITGDGLNQQRAVPAVLSEGARDPSWSKEGNQLLYAADDYIRVASVTSTEPFFDGDLEDQTLVETLISSTDSFLEDFRSPVFDQSTALIIFAARRKDAEATNRALNLYVATRTGRIVSYDPANPREPFFRLWEGVDIYDLTVSPSGQRMIFAANASSIPDTTSGIGAVPSTAARLFAIENLSNCLNDGDPPAYSVVTLASVDPNFDKVSARAPRISPDGLELVWSAYEFPTDEELPSTQGRVVRQPLGGELNLAPIPDPDPTPAEPTPTPGPTPEPVDEAQVVESGEFTFAATSEGWNAGPQVQPYDRPQSSYNAATGAIQLTAGSLNTFGYYDSPISLLPVQENSLILARGSFRAIGSDPARVPVVRLRANSSGFESAFLAETNSLGDLSLSPNSTAAKNIDLLFAPPVGIANVPPIRRYYNLAFDLLNFDAGDNPAGGISMENLELYRLDEDGRYYSLWGFRMPNAGAVTLTAFNANGLQSNVTVSLRTCCGIAASQVTCSSGNSQNGTTLSVSQLPAGFYTVVVSSESDSPITLAWESGVTLVGELGETCAFAIPAESSAADLCGARTAISGRSGSSTVASAYDGRHYFDQSTCDTDVTKSVVKSTLTVYETEFESAEDRDLWKRGPNGLSFSLPQFVERQGAIGLRVLDSANTFGFWSTEGLSIPVGTSADFDAASPTLIYRATFRIKNDTESDVFSLPDFRFRLASNEFQRSSVAVLTSQKDGATLPTPGRPKEVEVYMVLEQTPTSLEGLISAFDVLSFFPSNRSVTDEVIELDAVKIERVYLPTYPAPR